jgi:hypothetical protein
VPTDGLSLRRALEGGPVPAVAGGCASTTGGEADRMPERVPVSLGASR